MNFDRMTTAQLEAIPGITCPLSGAMMTDPALLVWNGVSYERNAIQNHLNNHVTGPGSTVVLNEQERMLLPNPVLKAFIDDIRACIQARHNNAA